MSPVRLCRKAPQGFQVHVYLLYENNNLILSLRKFLPCSVPVLLPVPSQAPNISRHMIRLTSVPVWGEKTPTQARALPYQ